MIHDDKSFLHHNFHFDWTKIGYARTSLQYYSSSLWCCFVTQLTFIGQLQPLWLGVYSPDKTHLFAHRCVSQLKFPIKNSVSSIYRLWISQIPIIVQLYTFPNIRTMIYWPNSIVYSYAFLLFWPPLFIIHNPLSSGRCCTVCAVTF